MTKVYFVRHAEPNYENHDDMLRELSARGMEDRKRVTAFLSDKQIDVVLSSPFKRAVDTVKDFADSKGLTVETVNDFRERKVDKRTSGQRFPGCPSDHGPFFHISQTDKYGPLIL